MRFYIMLKGCHYFIAFLFQKQDISWQILKNKAKIFFFALFGVAGAIC